MTDIAPVPPPQGLVTFLFTDVAGSTRLWEESPQTMATAMAEHDRLVDEVVSVHRGHLVRPRGEGDSRFVVFPRASDAVAAAVDIQRRVISHPWSTPAPVSLRVAVHTGEADLRDGDYYGRAVNRAARLRSAGHPGQILVSGATHDVTQDTLTGDITLRALGAIALADLDRPEPVYQVEHADLPREFPPLRSSTRARVKLPPLPADFVGRSTSTREIAALLALGEHRLVTLTGPGGAGKTQLAVAAAMEVREHFAGGVVFVPLADVKDSTASLYSMAAAIEVREQADEPLLTTICRALSTAPALLVLDNCEQVEGIGTLVAELLREGPHLAVLATSRAPLHLRAERRIPVPPLAVPDPDVEVLTVDEARAFSAVDFFIRRAGAVDPDFDLDDDNLPAVLEICRRVEGSPLALELAAARTDVLSLRDIESRLSAQLSLLAAEHSDLPERQRTVRATVEWSTSLLTDDDRLLLFTLGELIGPFSIEDAQALSSPEDVTVRLGRLVDSSLIQRSRTSSGMLFRIAEAVRELSHEALVESEAVDGVREQVLAHVSDLVHTQAPALQTAAADAALGLIRRRYEDVRSSVTWALETGRLDDVAPLLAEARRYWVHDGQLTEPRSWVDAWLDNAPGAHPWRPDVTLTSGVLGYLQDDYAAATERLTACCESSTSTAPATAALARGYLGAVRLGEGDPDRATTLARECEALADQSGEYESQSLALSLRAVLAAVADDTGRERDLYLQRLELTRRQGDARRMAETLNNLAEVCLADGDLEPAAGFADEALTTARSSGRMVTRDALYTQARIDLLRGDPTTALALAHESLQLSVDLGQLFEMSQGLTMIGAIAAARGQTVDGAELMAAGQRLRASGSGPLDIELEPEFERYRQSAAQELGLTTFEDLMANPRLSRLEDAVQVALGILPTR